MKRLRPTLLLLCLGLIACGKIPLHHNLTEIEANKIMVLLDEQGISAEKKKAVQGQEVSWTVLVPGPDISSARKLLVENNLPTPLEMGLSEVYSEKGLIPTPDEQQARFLIGLKGDIIKALRKIPGVYEVGLVLNVPTKEEFAPEGEKRPQPSASVVLRIGDPSLMASELTEAKIQRIVANAIPGMQAQDVVVFISAGGGGSKATAVGPTPGGPGGGLPIVPPTDPERPGSTVGPAEGLVEIAGIRLEEKSLKRFKLYLLIFLFVLVLLSSALLVTLLRMSRLRQRRPGRSEAIPIEGPHPAQLDAPRRR